MYSVFAFVFENSFLLRGVLLFIIGVVIGSFLNVVIYRLPIMLERRWRREAMETLEMTVEEDNDVRGVFNLMLPGSHCVQCKQKIPFWANLPVIGYFLVNGRCHKCGCKISPLYPLVELITGVLFALAGFFVNTPVLLLAYLVFIAVIICLIVIDYTNFILPDELTISFTWLGLLFNINGDLSGSLTNSVLGAIIGYISLWLIFWAFKLVTKRDGMGYGDFKLFAGILAWVGYQWFVPLLLVAPLLGILYYVGGRLTGKLAANEQIPFGAFLGIAAMIILFLSKYVAVIPLLI